MPQFARPISTLENGGWEPFGASTCHEATDEETPNGDTDYAEADSADTTLKMGLSTVTDPSSSSGHTLRFTAKASGTKGPEKLDAYLYQGATLICTALSAGSITRDSYNLYAYTLTSTEADAITDYSALRIWIAVNALGAGEYIRVTQAEFEVPDAGAYYHGLKVQGVGELALCDTGNNPLRVRKGGATYGVELVDTNDPNASAVRIKTSLGIKAIRKYT